MCRTWSPRALLGMRNGAAAVENIRAVLQNTHNQHGMGQSPSGQAPETNESRNPNSDSHTRVPAAPAVAAGRKRWSKCPSTGDRQAAGGVAAQGHMTRPLRRTDADRRHRVGELGHGMLRGGHWTQKAAWTGSLPPEEANAQRQRTDGWLPGAGAQDRRDGSLLGQRISSEQDGSGGPTAP